MHGTASWPISTRNAIAPWPSTSPGTAAPAASPGRSPSPAAWSHVLDRSPERFDPVRLLARRAHRPAGRAGGPRPRAAAGARVSTRRHRGPGRARAAPPRRRSPRRASSRRAPTSASSSAGAPSRCSPTSRRGWPSSPARTSAATAPARSPRCCGASARARWSPCGAGSESCRCRWRVVAGERDENFLAIARRHGRRDPARRAARARRRPRAGAGVPGGAGGGARSGSAALLPDGGGSHGDAMPVWSARDHPARCASNRLPRRGR